MPCKMIAAYEMLKKAGSNNQLWSRAFEVIPSYGQSVIQNPELALRLRAETAAILKINDIHT